MITYLKKNINYFISFLMFAWIAWGAVTTGSVIIYCVGILFIIVFALYHIALKNLDKEWVWVLYGFRGVRTDVKYMTKSELYYSGLQFLKWSGLLLVILLLFAKLIESNFNLTTGMLSFMLTIFSLMFFSGGIYMLIRGVFRKKNYIPAEYIANYQGEVIEDRNPILCQAFVATAKDILQHHPDLMHTWSIDDDEDHCILVFPKLNNDGFDVTAEVFFDQIIVSADGPHVHFDNLDKIDETVRQALGLIRDLLSPSMRVIELLSNNKAYKWKLELLKNNQWDCIETVGIFLYNYFGVKSKKIYQNKTLPVRFWGR